MGDVLAIAVALQREPLRGHAAHQGRGFFKPGGHSREAGAIGGESGLLPGEVGHRVVGAGGAQGGRAQGSSTKPTPTSSRLVIQKRCTTATSPSPPSSK